MVNKPLPPIVETLLALANREPPIPVQRDYYDLVASAGVPDEWADVLEAAFESDVKLNP